MFLHIYSSPQRLYRWKIKQSFVICLFYQLPHECHSVCLTGLCCLSSAGSLSSGESREKEVDLPSTTNTTSLQIMKNSADYIDIRFSTLLKIMFWFNLTLAQLKLWSHQSNISVGQVSSSVGHISRRHRLHFSIKWANPWTLFKLNFSFSAFSA